jgi:hypothetical protein
LETIAFLSSLILAGIFVTLYRLERRAAQQEDAERRQ